MTRGILGLVDAESATSTSGWRCRISAGMLRSATEPSYVAAHGAQKPFGWFGGPGFTGTQGFLGSMLGFRGLLWRRAECQVQLLSRTARDLGPWCPELTRAGQLLPGNTLVDGEIVICDESGWVDFAFPLGHDGSPSTAITSA